jgi:hypothetical protein
MEVLEVSGYVSDEKLAIADRYLAPQAKEANGLGDTDIKLDPAAIQALIRNYCRESGVRNLKKHIDKVRLDKLDLTSGSWLIDFALHLCCRFIERQLSKLSPTSARRVCLNRPRQPPLKTPVPL